MKCKYCGTKIPFREEFCPSCGKYAKSICIGISQAQYKTIYAVYCLGVSLLLLGFLYINHTRLFTGPLLFRGLARTQKRNLVEFAVISAVTIIICLIIMFLKCQRFSPWKFIYGLFSAFIIFIIEFFMILFSDQVGSSSISTLELQSTIWSLFSCAVLVGLIAYAILLKENEDVNIFLDRESEVISTVVISNITVMIVTLLSYILLC